MSVSFNNIDKITPLRYIKPVRGATTGRTSVRKATATMERTVALKSRAVQRLITAGNTATCTGCIQPVKFRAHKKNAQQVIANVYIGGVWDRVEHYHLNCYETAGRPYGPAT